MKRIVLAAIILAASVSGFSQTDSAMIEQYCDVVATPRMLSNKVTISIDYGEEKKMWKDSRLKDDEGKLKKFNTVVDALNYMGKDGWLFVNAFLDLNGTTRTYHYIFRKLFPRAETE